MRLRPNPKLVAILFFYLFMVLAVVVFSSTAGVFTYPAIVLVSLFFILALRLKVPVNGFLVGLIAAVASMGAVIVFALALGAVSIGSLNSDYVSLLLLGVVVEIFVGFGEELSFRATIFQGLSDELGLATAAVLSSAGFAVLHIPSMMLMGIDWPFGIVALATIFTAGVALALLYAYGGIFNAIAFHMVWNFIEYNLFNMGPLQGAINVTKIGPDILTGGAFGPEASVGALGVTVLLVIAIWLYYTRLKKAGPMISRPIPR